MIWLLQIIVIKLDLGLTGHEVKYWVTRIDQSQPESIEKN